MLRFRNIVFTCAFSIRFWSSSALESLVHYNPINTVENVFLEMGVLTSAAGNLLPSCAHSFQGLILGSFACKCGPCRCAVSLPEWSFSIYRQHHSGVCQGSSVLEAKLAPGHKQRQKQSHGNTDCVLMMGDWNALTI